MTNLSLQEQLFNLALKIREQAYAPYSGFAVGAALSTVNGNFYAGCNVENVSYPIGTCAEESAIAAMVAGGDTQIRHILIIAGGEQLIAPCGACLQRIKEFATDEVTIYLATPNKIAKILTLQDLLPFGFDNKELKK